jgi:hypothetical protein
MLTHNLETINDAKQVIGDVISRFGDKHNGGYFFIDDKDWMIILKALA